MIMPDSAGHRRHSPSGVTPTRHGKRPQTQENQFILANKKSMRKTRLGAFADRVLDAEDSINNGSGSRVIHIRE